MARILGGVIGVWLIYALLSLCFKHKIGFIITIILCVLSGISQAFVFGDFENDFIAAAIVSYHENEEADKPGNWSYVWTFEKEDVPEENVNIITCKDVGIYQQISGYGGVKWHMTFKDADVMGVVFNYLLKTIKNYLISNATVEAETAIELEGIFQARSAIEENSEVVCSIEVVGETKAIIKSDEDIEK